MVLLTHDFVFKAGSPVCRAVQRARGTTWRSKADRDLRGEYPVSTITSADSGLRPTKLRGPLDSRFRVSLTPQTIDIRCSADSGLRPTKLRDPLDSRFRVSLTPQTLVIRFKVVGT